MKKLCLFSKGYLSWSIGVDFPGDYDVAGGKEGGATFTPLNELAKVDIDNIFFRGLG
jgi:hypothetical protein